MNQKKIRLLDANALEVEAGIADHQDVVLPREAIFMLIHAVTASASA